MFYPKTQRIKDLADQYPERIKELSKIFDRKTNIYIDFANVIHWQEKLGWHIDLKRLKQLIDSFDTVNLVKFYNGTLEGDTRSEEIINAVIESKYDVHRKQVKRMKLSIDVSSIPNNSTDILKEFIRRPLLQKFKIETVEFLNGRLKELNQQNIFYIEDLKCNFDVEIGRDMLIDHDKNGIENFALWSGDSDFADPVKQLLSDDRKVILFATARRVSSELSELVSSGLFVFDIQKIKDFICWKKEMKHG